MLAALPLALVTPVAAHAELLLAVPAAGSTVTLPAPTELRLSFSEELELAFTKVSITGPDGQKVAIGQLSLDPADASILVVPLAGGLAAGVMTVDWTAVAADGHKSKGSYSLTVFK